MGSACLVGSLVLFDTDKPGKVVAVDNFSDRGGAPYNVFTVVDHLGKTRMVDENALVFTAHVTTPAVAN